MEATLNSQSVETTLVRLICDHSALAFEMTHALSEQGITCTTVAPMTLIVDTRPGVAIKALETLRFRECVVLCDKPNYWSKA
jgi:hypothetical protein